VTDLEKKFNPNEYTPVVLGIGTWLFAIYQSYHGIHYVPDEWILGVILAPFGASVYAQVRDKVAPLLGRLTKKD
jgi:hypothetical protein